MGSSLQDDRDGRPVHTAIALATLIKSGEMSIVEAVKASVEIVEAHNPELNAFVHLDVEEALVRAETLQSALARGEDIGPFGGVPVAMKDMYDSKAGWPTTLGGLPSLRHNIATFNSLWVDRMEGAGAIVLGKTNAAPLGFRATGDTPLFGATKNPFDPAYNSGGSSGGAAAAVGSGMVSVAQATDGGGSIRIPAALCNLVGLKPTFGRIPMPIRPNAFGATSPFLFDGVVSRTVMDSAVALNVLEGYDSRDPFVSRGPKADISSITGDVKGLRIAYSPDLDVFPVDSEVKQAVRAVLAGFEDAGAIVEEVKLGFEMSALELGELWCRLIVNSQIEALDAFKLAGVDIYGTTDLTKMHWGWIDTVLAQSTRERIQDQLLRTAIFEAVQNMLDKHDLLVSPTTACAGIRNNPSGDTIGPSELNGMTIEPLIGWTLTFPFNFTGHPAISVPAGMSSSGLPIGMQIVGNRFEDAVVLNASAFVEQANPWAQNFARARMFG